MKLILNVSLVFVNWLSHIVWHTVKSTRKEKKEMWARTKLKETTDDDQAADAKHNHGACWGPEYREAENERRQCGYNHADCFPV